MDVERHYKSLLVRAVFLLLQQLVLSEHILLLAGSRDFSGQEKLWISGQASQSMTYPKQRPGVSYIKDFFQ